MAQNNIQEKYIKELRDVRRDLKTWKCENMGYNNRGVTVDEGLEFGDPDATRIYEIWKNIVDKVDNVFIKIMNEENIKDEQRDKRRQELQRFFTDIIARDILDGGICKGCIYHNDSKFYCSKGWDDNKSILGKAGD